MRFRVGQEIKVKCVKSGGNFRPGDIVEIIQIGDDDGYDMECYGAISPWDGYKWYLNEDEVEPITNADKIRSMTDDELYDFLFDFASDYADTVSPCAFRMRLRYVEDWLKQPAKEE